MSVCMAQQSLLDPSQRRVLALLQPCLQDLNGLPSSFSFHKVYLCMHAVWFRTLIGELIVTLDVSVECFIAFSGGTAIKIL